MSPAWMPNLWVQGVSAYAVKMATVRKDDRDGMLAAWSILIGNNTQRRSTGHVLIVCPNVTIRIDCENRSSARRSVAVSKAELVHCTNAAAATGRCIVTIAILGRQQLGTYGQSASREARPTDERERASRSVVRRAV